ncbi:Inner membrane protein YiaW [Rosistilla oblonga]|uniref:DUF3302 domain-containing protein n=1 Tax=Rosistilla oblonga TaxID=2527990 RepID=UPI00118AC8BB|nr:DUF3302 domain-containing protein [Rosistilla oblonga]QDV13147.1 Inner membrane protein YiaW [Rosistilla oblonga]
MFLDYVALCMILIVLVILFYTFIYIHELPYESAKHRNHPQQDAIYVACWLSLFTLHAIWPLVFLWALSHKEDTATAETEPGTPAHPDLLARLAELESRIKEMEQEAAGKPSKGARGK